MAAPAPSCRSESRAASQATLTGSKENVETVNLHVLSGQRFDTQRFTCAIALELAARAPIDIVPVEGFVGSWEFHGVPCRGLIDDVFILENPETRTFKIVDFQDSNTITQPLAELPGFRGAAVMMYHPPSIHAQYGTRAHLFSPGWFTDQAPAYVRYFRDAVAFIRRQQLDPRLYFRGTIDGESDQRYRVDGLSVREVAVSLRQKYPDEVDISADKLLRPDWFFEAARHVMVLTLPGHPWCYREFEMMNLGIPFMTYRWTSFLYHQPVHYVPVEGVEQHRIGFALDPDAAADAIMERFRAVRDDRRFLDSLAGQAQRWYDLHWTPAKIAEDMLTFFDLPSL